MIASDRLSLPLRPILAHRIIAVAILASQQKGKKEKYLLTGNKPLGP